jgi:hypothetical protein
MPRITKYPAIDGSFYIHHCQKPGPKPLPKALKRRRVDITLSPFAIKAATEKADAEGLSFSRYVEKLIYDDCIHIQSVYK